MYDHVNYARAGPGAAKGITMLRGDVVSVRDDEVIVSFMGANGVRTVAFYSKPGDEWKRGQTVEITIASFDA